MVPAATVDLKICDQLLKLENDSDITAASNFENAQHWESWNTRLGLGVVLLSGIVTSIGAIASSQNQDQSQIVSQSTLILISTILASTAAVLGSILTFLKPSERASRYREFGNKHKSIRNRIRIYRTVSMNFVTDGEKRLSDLQNFLAEKDALNSDNPPIPRWAFTNASKYIADKQARRVSKNMVRTE